jgi:hypothetical protein
MQNRKSGFLSGGILLLRPRCDTREFLCVTRPLRPDSRFFSKSWCSFSSGSAVAPGSCTSRCVTVSRLPMRDGVATPDALWLPQRCDSRSVATAYAPRFFSKCWGGSAWFFRITLDSARGKGVTNRWDGEAESQWIVAARLLYHLQYLVPYLSRLQRIHLPDRLKLNAKRPHWYVPPAWGSSRHMLLGAHARPY